MTAVRAGPRDDLVNWGWVADHLDDLRADLVEHLWLTAAAVGFGTVSAAALTAVGVRWRWTLAPITWAAGVLYTIPSLALFVLLVPWFGIGDARTALLPLTGYTLLVLVRNFVAGVDGVSPDVIDAADGMGLGRWRRLATVELPIALPAVIAGIRIATVTTVGLVTVSAFVGYGGLGDQILSGLRRQFPTQIIVGGALSLALALAFDAALLLVERALTPWRRTRTVGTADPAAPEPLLEVPA